MRERRSGVKTPLEEPSPPTFKVGHKSNRMESIGEGFEFRAIGL